MSWWMEGRGWFLVGSINKQQAIWDEREESNHDNSMINAKGLIILFITLFVYSLMANSLIYK